MWVLFALKVRNYTVSQKIVKYFLQSVFDCVMVMAYARHCDAEKLIVIRGAVGDLEKKEKVCRVGSRRSSLISEE